MTKKELKKLIQECILEVFTYDLITPDVVRKELIVAMTTLRDMKSSKSYPNEKLDAVREYIGCLEKLYKKSKIDQDLSMEVEDCLSKINQNPELLLVNKVVSSRFIDLLNQLK